MNTYVVILIVGVIYYLINISYDLFFARAFQRKKTNDNVIDMTHFNSKVDSHLLSPTKLVKVNQKDYFERIDSEKGELHSENGFAKEVEGNIEVAPIGVCVGSPF